MGPMVACLQNKDVWGRVFAPMCSKLVKVMEIVDLFKMRLLKIVICASYVKILELC